MQLSSWESAPVYSAAERTALRLADAMVDVPTEVPDELFAALGQHFTEEQIVELASAIAWENYRARFNRVFAVESENYARGACCPLPIRPAQEP